MKTRFADDLIADSVGSHCQQFRLATSLPLTIVATQDYWQRHVEGGMRRGDMVVAFTDMNDTKRLPTIRTFIVIEADPKGRTLKMGMLDHAPTIIELEQGGENADEEATDQAA